jgi:hypothetical protein
MSPNSTWSVSSANLGARSPKDRWPGPGMFMRCSVGVDGSHPSAPT